MIESKQNTSFKNYKKLLKKKYRNEEKKFILEGKRLIEEAKLNNADIENIVLLDGVENPFDGETIVFSKELFNELSDTVQSQGVLAIVKKPNSTFNENAPAIVLDQIQDPGNLGTIIRTAKAFGFKNIFLTEGTVDPYNPKVVRSSLGGMFGMHIEYIKEISQVKDLGYKIYCATLENSSSFREVTFSGKVAIVIGNEANGISSQQLKYCKQNIIVPMKEQMESLNAATAASILMFEVSYQL